jgi:uncharacterized protein YbjT (DUF2867 family)
VDVRDIAAVAAVALTEPGHIGKTYTITGPAAVTHAQIGAAIGAAIGREISFVDVSADDFSKALSALGVPAWQVEGLVEDYAHYARGEASEVSTTVREVTGAEPRDVRTFARDYAGVRLRLTMHANLPAGNHALRGNQVRSASQSNTFV